MFKKLLIYLSAIIIASCSYTQSVDFPYKESSVNNFYIGDLNNIRKGKSCMTGRKTFGGMLGRLYVKLISHSWLFNKYETEEDYYDYLKSTIGRQEGDATTLTAARIAGIKKVKMIDHEYSITGLLRRKYCVIVYGE